MLVAECLMKWSCVLTNVVGLCSAGGRTRVWPFHPYINGLSLARSMNPSVLAVRCKNSMRYCASLQGTGPVTSGNDMVQYGGPCMSYS